MRKTAAPLTLILLLLAATFAFVAEPASAAEAATENTWTIKRPLPTSIDSAIGAATVNGKIYAMSLSFNYEYNPTTDKWTKKASMLTPRANFAIAVHHNKIYIIGAYGYSCANEVYDPATDTWETKAPMPTNRTYLSASVFGGKIHLFSREGHDVYDVASDSWTTGNTPQAVIGESVVVDNKIYVISWNITQTYDPKSDTWSLGAVMPVRARSAAVCATTGVMAPKRIYVIGGSPEFLYYTNVTQVYDPISDTWALGESMPTARAGPAVASVDDQIYVIGGSVGMYSTSDVNEQYTPVGYGTPDPSYAPSNDSTAPKITVASPENRTYYAANVSLSYSVDEHGAWMRYKLDGKTVVEIGGNATITGLSVGSHNLTVYATDPAGNTGVTETIYFEVVEKPETEPFPVVLVAVSAVVVTVVIAAAGIILARRKRCKEAQQK